jgi:hypothetical protein
MRGFGSMLGLLLTVPNLEISSHLKSHLEVVLILLRGILISANSRHLKPQISSSHLKSLELSYVV